MIVNDPHATSWVPHMVPYGLDQRQFVAMYRRKLGLLSKGAIAAIGEVLRRDVGEGVQEASVVIFTGEDGGAPSAWIYFQGRHNKVDSSDPSIFPGRSLELPLGLAQLAEIDEEYFLDPESFPGQELAVPLLARWLAECWWKAGGWSYPLPTFLSVHDFESTGSEVLSPGGA